MSHFMVCLNAVLPILLLMALGYLARVLGVLAHEDVNRFNRVVYQFFLPVMAFYNVYSSEVSTAVKPSLLLFETVSVLALIFLCLLLGRLFVRERADRGVIVQGLYRSNFVIIGIPFVTSLLGSEAGGLAAVMMAISVPLFNVFAVILLEYYGGEKTPLRKLVLDILKNPLILGTLAGLVFLLLGWKLPTALDSAAAQMSRATSPMMLFLLGAFFRFDGLLRYRRALSLVCLGRLLVLPALFLSAALALGFRGVSLGVLIPLFGSSTAIASFAMAQQLGGNAELAGDIVVATSALCPLTLFFWGFLFKSLGFI